LDISDFNLHLDHWTFNQSYILTPKQAKTSKNQVKKARELREK
jgi:hypothetical protein